METNMNNEEYNQRLFEWAPVPSFKDATDSRNPPHNRPKHQPDHFHENGFDSRCGRCADLRQRERER
jgi:hypothetical protein